MLCRDVTNRQGVTPPSTDHHQDCHVPPSSSKVWSVDLEEIPKVLSEVCEIKLVSALTLLSHDYRAEYKTVHQKDASVLSPLGAVAAPVFSRKHPEWANPGSSTDGKQCQLLTPAGLCSGLHILVAFLWHKTENVNKGLSSSLEAW